MCIDPQRLTGEYVEMLPSLLSCSLGSDVEGVPLASLPCLFMVSSSHKVVKELKEKRAGPRACSVSSLESCRGSMAKVARNRKVPSKIRCTRDHCRNDLAKTFITEIDLPLEHSGLLIPPCH